MDKIVKVQVWDTAGQERYRSITNAYYRGAEGILIVFDVTKKESFENIQNWINEVTVYTGKDVVMICLGNKNDLKKGIDKKEIYEFQKKTGLEIINVSAKTGDGVEEAFKHIIELLIKKNLEAKENMEVMTNDVKRKAEELKVGYFETSALDGSNIEHAFDVIVEEMSKKIPVEDINVKKVINNNKVINIDVNKKDDKNKKGIFGCC